MDMNKYIGKQVVAFGAGDFGIQFAKKYNNVKLFLDNKVRYGEKITQQDTKIIIVNPDYYFNNIGGESYIVITMKEWIEVANYLENIGKRFYFDYLPVSLLEYDTIDIGFFEIRSDKFDPIYWLHTFANGKKLVGCYGECHMILYRQLLNTSKKFKDNYIFISMPTINDYNNRYKILIDNLDIWRNCDVVILNENEDLDVIKGYSSKDVINAVRNDCKIIKVTPAFFMGYFPQACANRGQFVDWNVFTWEDKNINRFLQQHKEKGCMRKLEDEDFYTESWIDKYESSCFKILKRAERFCDVTIWDYIKENYKQRLLFYSPTHPVNEVIEEIARRILYHLGIDEKIKLQQKNVLAIHEMPVYPSVVRHLGLKIDENRLLCPGENKKKEYTFESYVNAYIANAKQYGSFSKEGNA